MARMTLSMIYKERKDNVNQGGGGKFIPIPLCHDDHFKQIYLFQSALLHKTFENGGV